MATTGNRPIGAGRAEQPQRIAQREKDAAGIAAAADYERSDRTAREPARVLSQFTAGRGDGGRRTRPRARFDKHHLVSAGAWRTAGRTELAV